jgi:serine/threonine protein phosphatase PrpC
MGCTLVAAVVHDAMLSWASVGDSHLYLVRGGGISKLNADHSYGGFLDRMAALGQPVEPEPGCARNMLMCALTGEEIMEIDCPDTGTRISSGDWLIASSDGLNTLNRDDIIAILLARDGRIGDTGAGAVGARGHHPRGTTRSGPERPGARARTEGGA